MNKLFFYIQVVSWIFSHSKLTKLQKGVKNWYFVQLCNIQPKMSRWKINVLKSLWLRYTAPTCSSGSVQPLHSTGAATCWRPVTDAPLKLVGTFRWFGKPTSCLLLFCRSANVVLLHLKMLVWFVQIKKGKKTLKSLNRMSLYFFSRTKLMHSQKYNGWGFLM